MWGKDAGYLGFVLTFSLKFILCVCFTYMYVCAPCSCLCLGRSEVCFRFPGTVIMTSCETLYGCWELSLVPLEELSVLLATSPDPEDAQLNCSILASPIWAPALHTPIPKMERA